MANKKINQLVSKTAILSTDLFGIGDATTGQLFKKTIAELQAAIGGAVISVNGLVGTVVLDTDDVQELASPTNKYFTDARARGAISLTVTGNSGASTYSSGTGVLNVPTYTLAGLGGITASFLSGTSGISYNSGTGVISYSGTVYTDASIRALLSGSTGITYNSSTGAISYSGTVYTDSSVRALISLTTTGTSGASTYNNTTGVINVPEYTLAGLGGISLTSLSGGTGITYNSSTGQISYSGTVYTDASVRALISASGAVSYNNTTGVISLTSGNLTEATSSVLTITGGTGAVLGSGTSIQVSQASTSVSGFLSSTDWNTFNGKASALSGTTNYVAKFTSSTAIGNSIIYDDGTNVGIGTTTLSASTNYRALNINGTTGSEIFLKASNVDYGYIYANSSNVIIATQTAISLLFQTNTITRMTINSSGNIGIGTTSVVANDGDSRTFQIGSRLVVQNVIGSQFLLGTNAYYDGTNWKYIAAAKYQAIRGTGESGSIQFHLASAGTAGGAISNMDGSDIKMIIKESGKVGIGFTAPGGKLDVQDTGTTAPANGQPGTGFNVRRSDGVLGVAIGYNDDPAAFYIQSNRMDGNSGANYNLALSPVRGNVLIGTYTDNGERLYVSGAIRATGTITANSDISLKKNLLKIENALEKVEQINGYTYEFKADDSKRHAGVIAQEIQTVLPEIVNTGNDGLMGVEYGNISALLIEAIKEQNIKIKNLETLLASK